MYHYIFSDGGDVLKSCLCFDPSAPVDSRISQIADMNYGRYYHSLVVANGKLYAIGGWAEILHILIRNMINYLRACRMTWHKENFFGWYFTHLCNRVWRMRKSRSPNSDVRCLRCSECRTRKFENRLEA